MEIVAIILSIISIVATSAIAIINICFLNKNNERNLNASLVKSIYEDALINSIPRAREYIHFDGENITGVDKLIDAVSSIRRKSLFFKKSDSEYYNNIFASCQKLEDFLNDSSKKYSSVEFTKFMNEVDKELDEIVFMIGNKYKGK